MSLLPFSNLKLLKGKLLQRYKRFFADIENAEGEKVTVHCANSGSMKSLLQEGSTVWFSDSQNDKRKLRFSWELLELPDGFACVNTARANQLAEHFLLKMLQKNFENLDLSASLKQDFQNFSHVQREVKISPETRLDFCLSDSSQNNAKIAKKKLFVEVKSVTYRVSESEIAFPDSVTERGQKHLEELMKLQAEGFESMLLFVIMRGTKINANDLANQFRAAAHIDKKYSHLLEEAHKKGVKVRLLVSHLTPHGMGFRGYFQPLSF
jgi:sugar fermentation stimulation protein A